MRRGLLLLALLPACTFAPGTGFTTLGPSTLDARFEPGAARDLGDDTLLTDASYEVHFDAMALEIGDVSLMELSGGAGVTFDPSDPPDGYTLCHGGHCHADDGSLVSYAEIQAELAGDSAEWVPVVTLPVGEVVDALAGEVVDLADIQPSPELPLADLALLEIAVTRFTAAGTVTAGPVDGGLDTEVVDLVVDLPVSQASLAVDLGLVVDLDLAPEVHLEVDLPVGGTLFDELDLAGLVDTDVVTLDDPTTPAGASVVEHLLASELAATVVPDSE